jgi:thioredoxin-related protein
MKGSLLAVIIVCALGFSLAAGEWETDFGRARAEAGRDGKFVLVNFSGSDWCGWCTKLDREVFSQAEFQAYAQGTIVLVLADFPHKTALPEKQAAANKALAAKYRVSSYPTVVLMLPDGTEVARTGYRPGGAAKYVEHLAQLLAPHTGKLPKASGGGEGTKIAP